MKIKSVTKSEQIAIRFERNLGNKTVRVILNSCDILVKHLHGAALKFVETYNFTVRVRSKIILLLNIFRA